MFDEVKASSMRSHFPALLLESTSASCAGRVAGCETR